MSTVFGVPTQALFGQLLIGLINGSFYAMLSLGLSVIFGLLNIINFAHGAQYMMGAFVAYFLLQWAGLGYWWALVFAPIVVGLFGVVLERTMIRRLYHLDHLYGLLLTFGFALVIQGLFRHQFGSSGLPYAMPALLSGGHNLGFMFLPNYRAWVIVFSLGLCLATWYVIERTKLGSYLRAATENPALVQAFGVNVPRMVTLTYGFGVALAGVAGVLAAPIYQVNPLMGADLIIVVFAVVVIGGLGSIMGSIVTGFALGVIEGLTKVFYPEASNTVIFVIMAVVLVFRPTGYISAHTAKVLGWPPELAILAGTAVAAALGVVIGALAIRSKGIYFANITLALSQMVYFFYLQAPFTHGEDGIQAVPRGIFLGIFDLRQTLTMYFVVLAIFLAGFLVIYRIIHSPFGQVLKAIRENEPRAVSLGYSAERYKLLAFVLSGTLAGLAGRTKAIVFQLASLTDVHWTMSGEVVLMTLLGGLGTVFGPVVGAFIMITLEHYLAQIGAWVTIVQGLIFVVCVLTFRRGVIGELAQLLRKPL